MLKRLNAIINMEKLLMDLRILKIGLNDLSQEAKYSMKRYPLYIILCTTGILPEESSGSMSKQS